MSSPDPMAALAAHAASLRFEDLSAEAVRAAGALTADALACALLGSKAPGAAEVVELHVAWGGTPEATVLAGGARVPAPTAAFLNSLLVHGNDFDDTHDPTQNHVFCTVLPAALAAGEAAGRPATGRDLIAALAAAVETMLRINLAVHPYLHRGFLPTSVFGAIGAAVAAARMLGLGPEGVADAAGIGFAQAQGNRQALLDGTLTKRIQPAFSARAGVHAAFLAAAGVTGPRDILLGDCGVFALYGGGKGDLEAVTADLGRTRAIASISLKPYPCCRASHPSISAALEARARLGAFDAREIEEAAVAVTPIAFGMIGRPFRIRRNPQVDAQFSAAWTAAFALLRGAPGARDFLPENVLMDGEVRELAGRITVRTWAPGSMGMAPAHVTVRLKGGGLVDVAHRRIRGSPEWPMTEDERRAKFLACAASAARPVEQEKAAAAFERLSRLEEIEDVREEVRRLAGLLG